MALAEELDKLAPNVQTQLKGLIEQVKTKLGQTEEFVMQKFNEALQKVANLTISDEAKKARAWSITRSFFRQELRSPALFFEGVVLGVAPPFDTIAQMRRTAKEVFAVDPDRAVREGFTNSEGIPLDNRKTFSSGAPNANYGKPLPEHAYITNVFGIARKQGEADFKPFKMMLGDAHTNLNVPLNQPVTFRANIPDRQPDPSELRLNPYAHINFASMQVADFKIQEIYEMQILAKYRASLNEIPQYHVRNANDPQRVVITQGDVQFVGAEPNPVTGNRMLVLDDETLPDDANGITAWVPPHLFSLLDCGMGSRIIVVGNTVEATFREGPTYLINVHGLYAIAEFKIAPDEVATQVVQAQQVQ